MRATIASIVAPSSSETSPSRKFCKPWSLLYTPGLRGKEATHSERRVRCKMQDTRYHSAFLVMAVSLANTTDRQRTPHLCRILH